MDTVIKILFPSSARNFFDWDLQDDPALLHDVI
jgi:hypothetical protein